jgi:hypothetical protein
MAKAQTVLVVEDEPKLASVLRDYWWRSRRRGAESSRAGSYSRGYMTITVSSLIERSIVTSRIYAVHSRPLLQGRR